MKSELGAGRRQRAGGRQLAGPGAGEQAPGEGGHA